MKAPASGGSSLHSTVRKVDRFETQWGGGINIFFKKLTFADMYQEPQRGVKGRAARKVILVGVGSAEGDLGKNNMSNSMKVGHSKIKCVESTMNYF